MFLSRKNPGFCHYKKVVFLVDTQPYSTPAREHYLDKIPLCDRFIQLLLIICLFFIYYFILLSTIFLFLGYAIDIKDSELARSKNNSLLLTLARIKVTQYFFSPTRLK